MAVSALLRFFPPPSYLKMPSLGVDISDTSLKYISLSSRVAHGSGHCVAEWGDIDIPAGTLERGEVINPQQLTSVLSELSKRTKTKFVRVSLPEERAYLFETEIRRGVPLKEVRSLLEFRLEENVPIPARDVFFDYSLLPVPLESRVTKVVVAAYARETIQTYYDACVLAGLTPLSFEVEAQAMARAVIPNNIAGSVMLVDFGKTRTGVGILHGGQLLYTSTIDIGGMHLSQMLRKELGEGVAEADLTKIKNTKGLVRETTSSTIRDTLLATVSAIKDELGARMQYWHTQASGTSERRIKAIYLCGGSANLNGLPEYLSETLQVKVLRANAWENACDARTSVPPIDKRHSYGYATAIGLALSAAT